MSEEQIVDKFLLGFFGYIFIRHGYDFWKTMVIDNDKESQEMKNKIIERKNWVIENSIATIDENITTINEKLTDIQNKITEIEKKCSSCELELELEEPNDLTLIPKNLTERGKIEYDDGDLCITPEVRGNN